MPDAVVIVNTSPVFFLHQVNCFGLLHDLYGQILVPDAVATELDAGRAGGADVPDLEAMNWIDIHVVSPSPLVLLDPGLDSGEAAVITMGLQMPGSLVVLDDRLARRASTRLGLKTTGTLGILLRAKASGLIPSVSAVIHDLVAAGLWLSPRVIGGVRDLCGE